MKRWKCMICGKYHILRNCEEFSYLETGFKSFYEGDDFKVYFPLFVVAFFIIVSIVVLL